MGVFPNRFLFPKCNSIMLWRWNTFYLLKLLFLIDWKRNRYAINEDTDCFW